MVTPAHQDTIAAFAEASEAGRLLAIVANEALHLSTTDSFPSTLEAKQLAYFVRPVAAAAAAASAADLLATLQFGSIAQPGMSSLLRTMNAIFAPRIFGTKAWPESIKKDFTGQFHRYMAALTEATFEAKGKTVLYLPTAALAGDVAEQSKDKDFVQQLESVVIHWTRQIKEVVNNHDNAYNAEVSGPLEEIEFWRSRTVDLSGISAQLQREHVRKVVSVLEGAKSSYLERFSKLAQQIQDGSVEADNNLKVRSCLASLGCLTAVLPPAGRG